MKRLTKQNVKEKADLAHKAQDAYAELDRAIEQFNSEMHKSFVALIEPLVTKLNEALSDIREFCEARIAEMDDFKDARSERWLDSEPGQNYQCWRDEWDAVQSNLDDVRLDEPEEIDTPDVDIDSFDSLNEEVS